jgi:alpha-tubulin suppressor-like RCC1 family protein
MKYNHLIKYTIMFVVFAVFIIAEAFASMIVVTTTSDEASDSTYGSSTGTGISLREAVMQAADNPGDDDIFLNSGTTYTLTIAGRDENSNLTGDIDISDSSGAVTIHGQNAIVQAGTNTSNGIDRIFHIVSGTVYINRLTLRYGLVTGSTWTESGGAIYDSGTTTMKNCSLHDNSAEYSAGAFSNRSGTLNLIQCTIYNNTANAGGGAFNGIGATLNITNCTISGNFTTNGNGYGFLYNDGDVNMMNTTLSNNCEFSSIYRRNGIFTITNCLIEGALSSSSNDVGEIYSGGYNIIGYLKSDIFNATTGDIVGTDSSPANIGINTTLTNNGGPTDTHALLSTSDGRDTGTSSGAPLRDQRGYLRTSIDKGAFEYGATASSAPTDIIISSNSVDHNSPSDTTIGTLSATDSDSGETYSFVLVPGTGSTDNDSFYIDGNLLKTKEVIDYNTKSSYSIRLWVDDGISTYEKQMTISVNPNNPPTDISLSSDTIDENMTAGTSIGDFSTTDVDTLDTHTYTFGSGTGDTDNASFAISGNTLQSAAEFDYETKNSYSIRVRTTDISGDYYDKIFTITINDMNDSFFGIDASTTQNQTQPISIPITMNNLTNIDIQAIELNISYDPAVLTATGISLTGTVLENENYIYDYNTHIPGIIYTGFMSNASHFTGTGLCLYANFTVIGASGETSDITISTAIINNQAVSTSDGIFTVAPDAPPIFTGMTPHTINEDALFSTSLTITDYETNPCELTLTIISSDETLVLANTISYTCLSGNYYFSITPVADQYGLATITIIAEDSSGLTASASFDLTVTAVNDAPIFTANTTYSMNEDMSDSFTTTATDIETAGCSLNITWHSSDINLIPDENISYTCDAEIFYFSLTPVANQSGNLTLSFTITDAGNLSATHSMDITVTDMNDVPIIGSIDNQTIDNGAVMTAISITATDLETATCSLGMSMTSSNPVLIPTSNISHTCTSNSFYFTLTPVTGLSGASTITLVVTDSGGLTASTSFIFNVNLPPELSYIPNSGTAAGEISFTFVEAEGDIVSLTVTSSDQSLISDAAITINGTNSNTIQLTTTADIEQAISISLPQESNVHGLATINIEASATGGTVTETFNVIVSPPGSGNALTFDGDDDFIAFGSIDGSHPLALAGSQFSLAFWIKPAITGDSFQRIIDKSTAGLAADGYLLCLNTGNSLKFYLNGMARFTTDSNVLTANMWHHVVVTGDGSQYKCYVNGIEVGITTENSFELPPNATANLYIGTWYTESTREYHGQMDEVSIWNVALSEVEVRNYMCSRLTGNETGLLAYFRFDHFTGTSLTDLSGNNFHGTLTNMDNASWNISEAPLGDTSINDYVGSVPADFSVTLSHSDGDAFTALGDSGSYSGLHIYLVNEAPSSYTAPAGVSTLYTDHYFGVFPVGMTPSYSVAYHYSGNTSIATDTGLRLAGRANNSSTWFDLSASLDQSTTTLSQTGISAFTGISTTEFIPGMNIEPIIGAIAPQTMNEDTIISSLAITATDAETAVCDLNITFHSSDTALVPVDNISYTCSANTYYLSITPINNLTGVCEITITLTDAGGLASSGTLALTVTDVNDVPLISTISDQTTIEDLAVGSISLTVSDLEDSADCMDITITSSDTVLIPNDNITYTCTSNTYWLTITPAADQNGLATITVTVRDSGDLTAAYSFDLTITAVNDAPEISPISDAQTNEDTAISINFSISDTESDASSLALSINSSNQTLVAPESISISGTGTNRTILIMPADSEYGIVDITVSVSDGDLASTTSFALTVTQINDAPVFEARSMIFIGNGEYHNYAIDNSGAVWGWGNNASNQITSETTLNQSYPIKISDLDNVISLAGGLEHSLALKSDGTVWAWGANAEGQLGDGSNSDKATPVQVLNLSNIIEIAANQNRSMALESDGTVWAWGNNTGGRLGDGTTTDRNEPVELTSLTNIVQISIGFNHNLALKNDNTVWAWGKNSNGELGDGTITDRSSPVEITAISNVIMVSAGRYFSIALLNDGTVMAWGKNQAGQLGDASNMDRLTPVQVSGLTNVTFITAFSNFSHALKSDGSVWGWGNDTDGRLGDDSAANKNSPVQVLGLNDLMMISHGSDHSLSLSYDGTVRAWGTNDHGQLGDRTTLEKHIPTLVPIDVYAISIEEDSSHTIAEIITDMESSPCDLTLTFVSSDPVLFTNTNLTDTCNADTYAINITPTADMDGIATLTIIATDAEGLTSAKSLTVTVTPVNDTPVISSDVTFTMNEDATSILTLTATDAESADCSMDITFASSNTNLLPVENIAYTCASGVYHISIMPESNQSGNTALTITITDSGNLTATQSIALTVLDVNDPPQMGRIADQTTLEDIATSMISFTVTDNETAACSMTLIMTSSDPTLVPDEYLLSMCSGNEYSIVATPAMDQYGTATISVTITDAGGLAASTSFDLTVTDVDDSQYIWANHQAADVVLGQSDFTSSITGTTDSLFKHPSAIAVDPTTGKVFVCDRFNHRILRFSATNAAINGASAEAVLGQADFNSVLANRGGSAAANTLNAPNDLVVDHFGRLWVSDWTNNRVLRFDHASSLANGADADGVFGQPDFVTTSIDTKQNKMKEPTGIWIDPAGRLWVAEKYNHRVVWFDHAASKTIGANADGVLGQTDFNATASGASINTFNRPLDVIGDNAGNIFIADANDNRLLRFDNGAQKANGANADAVLGQTDFNAYVNGISENQFSYPLSCVMDNCGRLYVCDINNHRILIFNDAINKSNGADADYVLGQADFTTNVANSGGGISARSINTPLWIFFDTMNNHLWVADSENSRVLRYQMQIKTPPIMSLMNDLTIDEDEISNAISFTVTDINEQALTITYQSSDTSLISESGITFTGNQVSTDGTTYTVTTTATATTVTLNIRPESDQSGTASITITVTDPDGMADTQSFSITITNVNDAPYVANPIADRIATEGNAYAYTVPSNTFTDIDPGDILTYTATQSDGSALPGWLSFDPATGEFTGLPTNSDVGSITITVTATDNSAEAITDTFVLSVNNTNSSPVLDYPIADQTATQDVAYSFTFAVNTFSDDDVAYGDTISYTAMQADGSPLPFWLTFDIYNRNFSGIPTNYDVGMYTITVIAEDTLNLTAMDRFYLTVVNINDAPEISDIYRSSAVISGLTIDEDSPVDDLSFSIYDMDVDDTSLTVSLESSNTSLVPVSNMSYSCTYGSCIMSLTPVANENGTAIITVIVTDPQGLTASNAFDLTVTAVNDTPVISSISNQSIIEDHVLDSVSFTASDIETSDCNFTLSVNSSYTQLIPIENITYSCSSGTYHLSITPAEDQSGFTTITIAVSDSGNLSVSESFDITVVPAGPGNVDLADGSGDLKVWFKADTLSSLNDGDSVATWSDSSGNNNDAAQSNAPYRPVYRSAAFNNQPAVEFDGVSLHCLTGTASQALSAPATIIFVAKDMGSTDLVAGVFSSGSGGIGIFSNAGLEYVLDGNGAGRDTSSNTQMPINTSRIITGYYSQNSTSGSKIYLSGIYEENYTGSGFSTPGSTSFEIGGRTPSVPSRIFKGQIAEIAVYSRELTPVAQTHIELYLMDKYDIDLVGSALDADLLKNARGISKQSEVTISGSSAGLTIADAGFLQDNDDIVMIGHNELLNQEISDDLPTGPTLRWSRTWKVIVNDSNSDGGAIQMIFGFNSAGMQTSPSSADAYSLLYRSGVSGSFALVGTTSQSIDGNAVIFNVPNIQNGYYTIGSTDSRTQNEAPVVSFAQALQLDGTDDYVVIPHSDILKPSTITVEAWIRADSWAANVYENVIIGSMDDETGTEGYSLRCGDNGTLDFTLGTTSSWQNASSPALMQAGVWTHVA